MSDSAYFLKNTGGDDFECVCVCEDQQLWRRLAASRPHVSRANKCVSQTLNKLSHKWSDRHNFRAWIEIFDLGESSVTHVAERGHSDAVNRLK